MISSSDSVVLQRDCDAIRIPNGDTVLLQKGTSLTITQSLGGNYTVVPSTGGMYSIQSKDADALGLTPLSSTSSSPANANSLVEEKDVWEKLKTCFDPEIPVNIVDLGLIYDLRISQIPEGGQRVDVKMTLTAQGCGMGPYIAADAQSKILQIPGVVSADVQVVWDPPWNQSMISVDGRAKLGMV